MNAKLLVFTVPLWLLCSSGMTAPAEPKPENVEGWPEKQFIASPAFRNEIDAEDLAEALGILHFNFEVQVPDGNSFLTLKFHFVQQGKDQGLGQFKFQTRDASGNATKAKRFRVEVMLMPLDNWTSNPLFEARKFRVFVKGFLGGNPHGHVIIDNPFSKVKPRGGLLTHILPTAVQDPKLPPGASSRFGTRFVVLDDGDSKSQLQISFERE